MRRSSNSKTESLGNQPVGTSGFMCKYSAKQFEKCSQGEMVGEGRQSDGRLVEPVDYVAADKKCLDKRVFSVLMCETHLKTL